MAADTLLVQRMRDWLGEKERSRERRIPPERTLSQTFGVSRFEVRKALAVLEMEGRLSRQIGRGTFLVDVPESDAHILDIANRTSPVEAMQARLILEPELAKLAAVSATIAQVAELQALTKRIRKVTTWAEYMERDADLHNLIAEASDNTLLAELHATLNGVRKIVVWTRIDPQLQGPPPDYYSFAEHEAIVDAIARRDRTAAAEAMAKHISSTSALLFSG
jgi:DNA-binding FadR family transcriptional regulator